MIQFSNPWGVAPGSYEEGAVGANKQAPKQQLFLFLKLDLLAEELRIAGVFCQERNYGG